MELPSSDAALQGQDQQLIEALRRSERPEPEDLATCARLRLRYPAGPMRRQLDQQLLRWDISEHQLHTRTRAYWQARQSAAGRDLDYGSGADS